MKHGKLAVLEGNWDANILKQEISRSVQPFLDGLEGELGVDFLEGEFTWKRQIGSDQFPTANT